MDAGHSRHGPMKKTGMADRGVTRPMAEMHGSDDTDGKRDGHSHEKHHGHGHQEMSHDDRLSMLQMHHRQTLWIYWTILILGVWLLLAPASFGYLDEAQWVNPSGGRGAWWSDDPLPSLRAWLMTVSDVVCGLLLLVFGWRSLTPNRPVSLWICGFVGMWLVFAPILFWAPTVASYVNDSIVGMLLIALTILIPGMPNMILFMQHGPATPPGWTYNPSSWPQRWIMIATGFAGFVVSRYLAMFQLGYIDYVWDPFFGFALGTERVLNSKMSHSWPVSDAGLGTVAYTFEFLMGYMGSPARWRTMPWMVAFFGMLVIPLGLTHIALVISQPVIVHHWCALCLLAAAIMLPMIPLEVDEVVAMVQHLLQAKRRGDRGGSLWSIFWKGGKADGCTADERSPELIQLPQKMGPVVGASLWGMSFPWTLWTTTALGVALMFLPTLFGLDINTTAADVGHLGGAMIVTVSVISMGEVVRIGRYLNLLLGAAVVGGVWIFGGGAGYASIASVLAIAVAIFSLPRGPQTESYGSWDAYIR